MFVLTGKKEQSSDLFEKKSIFGCSRWFWVEKMDNQPKAVVSHLIPTKLIDNLWKWVSMIRWMTGIWFRESPLMSMIIIMKQARKLPINDISSHHIESYHDIKCACVCVCLWHCVRIMEMLKCYVAGKILLLYIIANWEPIRTSKPSQFNHMVWFHVRYCFIHSKVDIIVGFFSL